jgi:hypothetical protein
MKDSIVNAFDFFQIADLDDDMVGMCKALVDWMKVLRAEIPGKKFPAAEPPERFYKMDPHQPKMELRKNLRKMMAHSVKYQTEEDFATKIKNIYVTLLATTYIYHMPTEKIVEASLQDKEFTREEAKEMLLADNMSPNWLKEPSGKNFTAIML